MKKLIIFSILSFLIITLSQCTMNCDSEMDNKRDKYGSPEEISKYESEGYHSVDWWYWSKGIEFTFKWGTNVDGCEVSKYTFEPHTNITDSIRTVIDQTKQLEYTRFYIDCGLTR